MNAEMAIKAKAAELSVFLRDCETRCRATDDEAQQLGVLAEAMAYLGAEAIQAHARAEILAQRVAELEALAKPISSLPVM